MYGLNWGEDRNYRVDIFFPNEQEEYRRHSSLMPGYQEVLSAI
jgi:hypothetical protein